VNIAQNIEDNTRHIFHKKKVVNALTMLPDVEPEIHDTQRLHVTLSTIIDVEKTIKKNTETLSSLQNLPRAAPEIIRNDDAIKCGKSIRDTRVYMGKIKERDAVLASLPAIMPDLVDNKSPNELIVSIKDAALRVHKTKQNLAQTEIEMTNVENELNTVVASMGNTCPLCQGTIKSATSLLRHSHTEDCTHD
jgi:hypothetical protein